MMFSLIQDFVLYRFAAVHWQARGSLKGLVSVNGEVKWRNKRKYESEVIE